MISRGLVKVQKQLARLDRIVDSLGTPIDEEIKPTVAVLHALGFETTNSCAGHLNYGFPYVDIHSKLAMEFDKDPEVERVVDLLYQEPDNLTHIKKYAELSKGPKTANLREAWKLLFLLDEFYHSRNTKSSIRLILESKGGGLGGYRLHSQGSYFTALMTKQERLIWLKKSQAEMENFTEFLYLQLE